MKQLTLIILLASAYAHAYPQTARIEGTGSPADTVNKKREMLRGHFFILAGVAFNSLKIKGDDSYYETQIPHQVKLSEAVQVGVNFPLSSAKSTWFIAPRISFYSLDAKGTAELHSGLATFHHESSVQSKLIINPGADIGYNFINLPAFKAYAAGGLGGLFFIGGKNTEITTYSSGDETRSDAKPAGLAFVLNAEAGFEVGRHAGIKLGYQPPVDIFTYKEKKVMFSTLYAGVSWIF